MLSYKSKSGGIVSVLEDMLEKAKGELAAAQKAEMNSKSRLGEPPWTAGKFGKLGKLA